VINWSVVGYALLCIVVPLAWGLLVVRISNGIEHKLRGNGKSGSAEDVPPIDYHI
jgi:hypothetical protein